MAKMTASQIVYTALIWAEESMYTMIDGTHESDPHRAELKDELKQLRAYRKRRYGQPSDPFAGATAMSLEDLRKLRDSSVKNGDQS